MLTVLKFSEVAAKALEAQTAETGTASTAPSDRQDRQRLYSTTPTVATLAPRADIPHVPPSTGIQALQLTTASLSGQSYLIPALYDDFLMDQAKNEVVQKYPSLECPLAVLGVMVASAGALRAFQTETTVVHRAVTVAELGISVAELCGYPISPWCGLLLKAVDGIYAVMKPETPPHVWNALGVTPPSPSGTVT